MVEHQIDSTGHILLNSCRDANPARLRQPFKTGGDIDAIAEDIAALHDDIALVNTDTKVDPFRIGDTRVALSQFALHFGRTSQSSNDAAELDEQTVSRGLHQPTAMFGNPRVYDLGANGPEPAERPL